MQWKIEEHKLWPLERTLALHNIMNLRETLFIEFMMDFDSQVNW